MDRFGRNKEMVVKLSPITDVPEPEVNRNGISIFPNPATSQLVVSGLGLGVGNIEIYNVLGELILSPLSLRRGAGGEVDISSLPPGIYFLKATIGGRVEAAKFIKAD